MSLDHDLLISSITGKGQEDKFSLHDSGEDDETKQGCLKKKKKRMMMTLFALPLSL